jgi:hypothetical protein
VRGIVGQEGEPLPLRDATVPAGYAPDLDREMNAQIPAGEVADAAMLAHAA